MAERATYRPPIKAARMAQVREYADAHGIAVAEAVDVLIAGGLDGWQRPGRTGRPKKETKP